MPQSVDGDIRLSASFKLDTSDVKQQAKQLKQSLDDILSSKNTKGNPKLEKLATQLQKSYFSVEKLQQKLHEAENAKVPTAEYKSLTNELDKTDKKIQDLISKQEKMETLGQDSGKGWQNLQYDLEILSQKFHELEQQKKELELSGKAFTAADPSQVSAITQQLAFATQNGEQLRNKFNGVKEEAEKTASSSAKVGKAFHAAGTAAKAFSTVAKTALNGIKKVISGITSTLGRVRAGFSRLKDSAKNAFHNVSKDATSGLKKLLRYGLGIRGLFMLFRKLRGYASDAFKGIAQQSASFNKTMSNITNTFNQFKGSIGTALQPLITIVEPVLIRIMNLFINAANAVGSFFATLTGQKYIYKAVKANNSYADSVSGTGKAAKEARKELAAYDKLMVISSQDAEDAAGGGSGGGGGFTEELVDPTNSVSKFAQDLKDAWESQDFAAIGEIVGNKINEIVGKIDEAIKWDNVGPKIEEFTQKFGTAFNSLIDNVDWELIGQTVGDGLNTIQYAVESFLDNFNIDELGTKFSTVINSLVNTVDWENLGEVASKGLNEITAAVNNFAYNVDWKTLGSDIGSALSKFIKDTNAESLGKALAAPFESANQTINGFLKNFEKEGTWSTAGEKIGTTINSWFSSIDWDTAAENITMTADGLVEGIISALNTLNWEQIGSSIGTLINGVIKIDWKNVGKAASKGVSKILDGLTELLDTVEWETLGGDIVDFIVGIEWGELFGSAVKTSVKLVQGLDKFLDGFRTKLGEAVKKFFTDDNWRGEHIGKPIADAISESLGIDSYWTDSWEGLKLALMQLWNKAMDYLIEKKPWMKWWYEIWKIDDEKINAEAQELHNKMDKALEEEFGTFEIPAEVDLKGDIDTLKEAWKNIDSKDVTLRAEAKEKTAGALEKLESDWTAIMDKNPQMSYEAKEKIKGALADLKANWDKVNDKNPILAAEAKEKVANALKTLKGDWSAIESKTPVLTADAKEKVTGSLKTLYDSWNSINKKDPVLTAEAKEKTLGALDSLEKQWEAIQKKDPTLTAEAKEKVSGALKSLKDQWSAIDPKNPTLTAEAKEKIKGDLKTLKDNWDAVKNKSVTINASLGSKVKETVKGWWTTIKNWFKGGSDKKDRAVTVGATNNTKKSETTSWWNNIKSWWGSKSLGIKGSVNNVEFTNTAKGQLAATMKLYWNSTMKPNYQGPREMAAAHGGVFRTPTHVYLGENGPEAVVPLKNNTEWLDIVSKYVTAHMNLGKIDIPHLAQGSVIPPNRQFLAMLGDQRHGTNVETPLKTIEQALENVMRRQGSSAPIILQLDGKQIAKVVWSESDKRYKQTGKAFA